MMNPQVTRVKKIKLIIALILTGILFSCSIRYIPVKTVGVRIDNDFAIVKTKEFILTISNKYWIKDPQNLTDYFTTFYVSVRNRTNKNLSVQPSDFVLLDEYGNQYDAVLPEQVLDLMLPQEIGFDSLIDITPEERQIKEDWQNAKNDLMYESFHFGKIYPGARKRGFIFFPRLKSENKKCKIIFKGKEINFVRES